MCFVRESQRIESEEYRDECLAAHQLFLQEDELSVHAVVALARSVTANAGIQVRSARGMDVYVGSYTPPPGGYPILQRLHHYLNTAEVKLTSPAVGASLYGLHCEYETLHPLTDGNGRTGRAIVLWLANRLSQHERDRILGLGFLRWWYYESLGRSRTD